MKDSVSFAYWYGYWNDRVASDDITEQEIIDNWKYIDVWYLFNESGIKLSEGFKEFMEMRNDII